MQPDGKKSVAMFKQISMTNFKSWRETGPVRMAPLTGFFGANSSGKSSLLQMLLLLKQTAESNDRSLVLKTGSLQEGYVNLGTAHEITYGSENKLSLGIVWEFDRLFPVVSAEQDEDVTIREFEFETSIHAEEQKVHVDSLRYQFGESFSVVLARKSNNHYGIRVLVRGKEPRRPQSRPRVYMKPVKCYGFSYEAIEYYRDADYLHHLEFEFEWLFRQLFYLGPLREYPRRQYTWGGERPTNVGLKGELAVPAVLAGRGAKVYGSQRKSKRNALEARIAQWLVDLDLASSFKVEPVTAGSSLYQVRMKRHRSSPEVLITDMGIGVSQVLPVLVLCYYVPEGSTVILEQPELHLHPSVQAGLADVFIDVIKNRNLQILLESHSEHLLRRLQRHIAEESFAPDDTALYFCDMQNGESKLTPLDVDIFGNISNWPDDFFGDLLGEMVAAFDASLERKQLQANGS